jgi:RNA 2',3'-cyclic 3'-phosphodiesterase
VRVFVALDISEEVRAGIREYLSKLQKITQSPRWVRPEGMHLTLKFIGWAQPELVDRIKSELHKIRSHEPVKLHFRGIGYFPNDRRPRVLWVGIDASENLTAIAEEIEKRMAKLGVEPESRKFTPHLTLARFESPKGLDALHREIERLKPADFGREETDTFFLFQSVLKRSGAEYTKLEAVSFVNASSEGLS